MCKCVGLKENAKRKIAGRKQLGLVGKREYLDLRVNREKIVFKYNETNFKLLSLQDRSLKSNLIFEFNVS